MDREPLILNVDDTEDNLELRTILLESEGLRVIEARTGLEALARVAADLPHVVILDISLPDIDGYEVCRRIRAHAETEWISIVHVTARYVSPDDWRLSVAAGANSYLTHPIDPPMLISTIQSLLRRQKAERNAQVERDRLREHREERETLYRSVLDQSLAAVYVIQERRLTFSNEALSTMLATKPDELRNMTSVLDLVHPDDLPRVAETLRQRESAEIGSVRQSFRARRGDGSWATLETHGARGMFEGRPAIIGLALDVTRRQELEEQLRQAQKMEAIGQLAGGIAHDFNNLLTAILGYSGMALEQIDEDKPIYADLREVVKAANSAAALTRKLLAFGRRQVLRLEVMDLNAAVESSAGLLQRLIDEHIVMELQLAPDAHPVTADPTQLEQIVLTLVLNARDAMPAGGRVTIATTEFTSLVPPPFLPMMEPGRYAQLTVRDTGCGMTAETKARLFEPFFTTKGPGKGTGLGLATVYGTVKQLQGYIAVESAPGKGATFSVFLPVANQPKIERASAPRTVVPVGRETILLVEDEPAVLRLAETVLRRHGYTVVSIATPAAALEYFAKPEASACTMMISDVVMPGMTGAELTRQLRQQGVTIPVLLMSGYADAAREAIAQLPAVAFLPKPFAPQVLLEKVRGVLDSA
jgi:two-component system cell cycle sensor histidine kinase/response regulator CckA